MLLSRFPIFFFIGSEFPRLKLGSFISLAGRPLVDYALPYGEGKILTHVPPMAETTWDYWIALPGQEPELLWDT